MRPVSPVRRRAERFDAALEGASTTVLDPHTTELLALVGALRATTSPAARTDFVADLRAQLMLAAESELGAVTTGPVTPARSPRTRRERRVAVALGGFALIGASASMAVAAQSALPGDTLYPLKRAIENADTRLSTDDQRGSELLSRASTRLSELDRLSRDPLDDAEAPILEATLDAFSAQADEASTVLLAGYAETGDQQAVNQLHDFAGVSLARLGRLESDLPRIVRPSVLEAAQTLLQIDAAATRACPACDAVGITQVPGGLVAASDTTPTETLSTAVVVPEAPPPSESEAESSRSAPKGTEDPSPATIPEPPIADEPGTPAANSPAGGEPGTSEKSGTSGTRVDTGVVGGVVDGLTGRGKTSTPTSGPTAPLPEVGQAVPGTVEGLNDATDTLLP